MNNLPPEILQNIFNLLYLDERIPCLSVCRSWRNVLDKYCLFNNVDIYRNVDQFTTFMDLMEQSPRHAAQVTELLLVSTLPLGLNKRKLCSVFPNVRVLKVEYMPDADNSLQHFEEPLSITHSTPKVRVLADGGYCELASQMLYSNICGRLEELDLNFMTLDSYTPFLTQLKHAPALRKIHIMNVKIGLNDLEDLHKNVLTLQDYWIQCRTIFASKMSDNIVPLPSMERFQLNIHEVADIDTHIAVYKYMTKKYINAKGGTCLDFFMNEYTPSDAKLIYDSTAFDFLRAIAPKSSKFSIAYVPEGIRLFRILENVDCEFEKMHVNFCRSGSFIQDLA